MATVFEKIKEQIKKKNIERGISPIEQLFLKTLYECKIFEECFEREYPEPPYSIDFAFPQVKIAVELDGHEFHQDKEKDMRKDEFLKNKGWEVIRITGRDVVRRQFSYKLKHIFDSLSPSSEYPFGVLEMLEEDFGRDAIDFIKYKNESPDKGFFCDYCNTFHTAEEGCQDF